MIFKIGIAVCDLEIQKNPRNPEYYNNKGIR